MVSVSLREKPSEAIERNAPDRWTAVKPVPGTPAWAHPARPGTRAPAKPWEPWRLPSKRPFPNPSTRRPSPTPVEQNHAWRIDFTEPSSPAPTAVATTPEQDRRVRRRLAALVGLAYLLLTALTTGFTWSAYFADSANDETGPEPRKPEPDDEPDSTDRHPDAPGLHVRADGSRYLIMPLPTAAPGGA